LPDDAALRAGDLREIRTPEAGRSERVGLVLHVHPLSSSDSRLVARVALVATAVGMASDLDYIAGVGETLLPFDIVVETDVTRPLWADQLGDCYGRLALDTVSRLNASACHPAAEPLPDDRSGPPVLGAIDPRHSWKVRELGEMRALASDCLAAILKSETSDSSASHEPTLQTGDVARVVEALREQPDVQRLLVTVPLHWVQAASNEVTEPLPTELDLSGYVAGTGEEEVLMTVSPIGGQHAASGLHVRVEGAPEGSALVIVDHLGREHAAAFDAASGTFNAHVDASPESVMTEAVLELRWRPPA
jgi:hypothetical protein